MSEMDLNGLRFVTITRGDSSAKVRPNFPRTAPTARRARSSQTECLFR